MPLIRTAGHKLAVPVAMFPLLWNVSLGVYFLYLSYYDLNAYNSVTYILYNTDVITNIFKSIVHIPVGKLV